MTAQGVENLPNRGFLGDGASLSDEEWDTRERLRRMTDHGNFNFRVWAVAASGFFTDSYNLFATNVILPSIAFVYWTEDTHTWRETVINATTLVGSICGQILFGYLADRFGRTRLYGIELVLVVFSTIGVASCSSGFNNMSVLGWLCVWRFVMGVGIGAEYPLSAVITTEWSGTHARGRMLGAVFLMQPVGQIVSQIVGLGVLLGRQDKSNLSTICPKSQDLLKGIQADGVNLSECKASVDSIWRIVTGVGAAPAVMAIVFRFLIWDSGLYDLEVKRQGPRALINTAKIYPKLEEADSSNGVSPLAHLQHDPPHVQYDQFSKADLYRFFIEDENYKYLMGTSICWFLLDFAFYGLGMGNPRILAKIFASHEAKPSANIPSWNPDAFNPNYNIFDALKQTAYQSIWVVSVSSLVGSVLFMFFVDRIPRRQWLIWSFVALGILFVVTGATFGAFFHKASHFAIIGLVALCHFAFNFGANTLTFMIPAEIFPTCYRALCHGIAAAAGKLGSVIVLIILHRVNASDPHGVKQLPIFITFGGVMFLGALFAWLYIPEIQQKSHESNFQLENIALEDLGKGRMGATDGLPVGLRERIRRR